ncbi:MAG: AMP-binding protein [Pseudomonadota bacterium]
MASQQPDSQFETVPQLLARNVHQFGDQPAYRFKELGIWQSWNWTESAAEIDGLALGLVDLGLEEGDHVAIIGRNHPVLYWAMVAVQCAGGVPVPVYQDSVADEMAFVLEHCNARFAFAENQEQVDKIMEVSDQLPALECMIFVDPRGLRNYDRSKLKDFRDIQSSGRDRRDTTAPELERRLQAQNADTTCVMLYTSGTTGRPKGVVLSNRNVIEASRLSSEFDNLNHTDSVLAYLPMAWVGDFVFSIGQAYYTGFCVNCPESPDTMQMGSTSVATNAAMIRRFSWVRFF